MARLIRTITAALLAACALLPGPGAAAQDNEAAPGDLLVGMRPQAPWRAQAAWLSAVAGEPVQHIAALNVYRIRTWPGLSYQAAAARIRTLPGVLYVEPNGTYQACDAVPDDPAYLTQQYAPRQVRADLAWMLWQPTHPVVIGICDTGIDLAHPDLSAKLLPGTSTVKNVSAAQDDKGHGTHCAGIAAAQVNNGVGIAGIAGWDGGPGTDAAHTRLLPVKVLSKTGQGTDASISAGIAWAADHEARVINLSLSGGGSITLKNAVAYAWSRGCVVVAAAGNTGAKSVRYPAGYPNVISVAATDINNTLASYSAWGSWVSVAAPGDQVYSTLVGGYGRLSGTSMAAALVSGEVALIRSQNPALTNAQVRALVTTHTEPFTPYKGRTIGGGRVDVYAALSAAGSGTAPPPPQAPSDLAATGATRTSASLKWTDNASTETGFVVERAQGTGPFLRLGSTSPNVTTFASTGLIRGQTYSFRVYATGLMANSDCSNTVQVTIRR